MTVAELINRYRLTNLTDQRQEDARHARWWVEHCGTLPRGSRLYINFSASTRLDSVTRHTTHYFFDVPREPQHVSRTSGKGLGNVSPPPAA